MLEGKTTSGFRWKLEDDALDNYELLEALREIDTGNEAAVVDMINLLLPEEEKKALKDHIRSQSGRVSAKKIIQEVAEILEASKEGKNS